MKKVFTCFLILAIITIYPFICYSKDLKIGYVDIFKVFNDYDKTVEFDVKLDEKKTAAERKLIKKREAIEKMQNKLSLLKEKDRKKEEEKITKELDEYRELEQNAFTDIKKERDEKMKDIIEDIDKVVKEYAGKNGFDLIVNANVVLYGNRVMDITTDILKASNKRYKNK